MSTRAAFDTLQKRGGQTRLVRRRKRFARSIACAVCHLLSSHALTPPSRTVSFAPSLSLSFSLCLFLPPPSSSPFRSVVDLSF